MKNKTVQEEPSCGMRRFLWVFVSRCKGLEARSQIKPGPCSMAGHTMANTVRQSCEALAGNKACFVLVLPSISYKSNWPCVKCVRAATLPSDTDWLWLTISNMACSRPGYIIWQLARQRSKWKSDKNQRRQQTHFQSLETQLSRGVVLLNIKFVYSQDVWHVLKSSSRPWGTICVEYVYKAYFFCPSHNHSAKCKSEQRLTLPIRHRTHTQHYVLKACYSSISGTQCAL